jgi:hypothetical protein
MTAWATIVSGLERSDIQQCLLKRYPLQYMSQTAFPQEPRLLAAKTAEMDTLLTYHRTWETGLDAVTRVTVSNPLLFFSIYSPAPTAKIILRKL